MNSSKVVAMMLFAATSTVGGAAFWEETPVVEEKPAVEVEISRRCKTAGKKVEG